MSERVSTGLERLDQMLGGGLLPGTLTVVYGATGIGKTHLGVGFANHGRAADGAPGLVASYHFAETGQAVADGTSRRNNGTRSGSSSMPSALMTDASAAK